MSIWLNVTFVSMLWVFVRYPGPQKMFYGRFKITTTQGLILV
jgi:hypothetical protein